MTASAAGKVDRMRQLAANVDTKDVAVRPDRIASPAGLGQNGTGASAGPVPNAIRSHIIEWVAEQTVPRLAPMALVSVFSATTSCPDRCGPPPTHYLINLEDASANIPTVTPVISRALDRYAPFAQIAQGSGRLWSIDGSLTQLFAPGTSAIAVPLNVGASVRAALTLLRSPDATPFSLYDLVTLETLVAQTPDVGLEANPTMAIGAHAWQPALLSPPAHVHPLRDLMMDLMDGETPYDVARRLARAAQKLFDATSCVVYLVDPAQPPRGNRASPTFARFAPERTATGSDLDLHLRLHLAASVGSGVLLTPPWLAPAETAAAGTLFASTADGTVLMAHVDEDAPWLEQTINDELLIALPLRADGELVAILGMRGPGELPETLSIMAENFALIGANALLVSRRREADQSSILTLRSELARNRLAHDATVAMFGATDIASGLLAHANLLVPGIADGYLVYQNSPPLTGATAERTSGTGSGRIFSLWRAHEDMSAQTRFESWADQRLTRVLSNDRSAEELPLFLSDVHVGSNLEMPGSNMARPPAGLRSLAAVPLIRNGKTFGALVLVTTEHVRRFGQRDFALIASLAGPVARLLSAGEFLPEEPDRPGPNRPSGSTTPTDSVLLAGLAPRFIGATEIDEIIRLSAGALASHFGGWCVIELLDDDAQRTRTAGAHADPVHDWPRELWGRLSKHREASRGPAEVLRNGRSDLSVTIDWVIPMTGQEQDEPAISPALIPASSISAPMTSGTARVIGAISCFRNRPSTPFTLDDLATLELVADITGDAITTAQQRESEREVGAQQQWLGEQRTRLMAQLADAVMVMDRSQRIIFANFQARQLHGGVELPATVDDYLMTFQPREIGGLLFTARTFPLTVALTTETKQRSVWRFRTTGDHEVTVVAAVNPLRAEDGSINGTVLSLHDVSEHYEQESARQRRLIEISDELQSPIASIKGWSQYLAQRTQSPGETTLDSRAVDAIAKQTRLLQQVVERLVKASRHTLPADNAAGSRRMDIHEFLGHLIHTFQSLSPSRTITLSAPVNRPILGQWDSDAIGQIFGTLLANAMSSGPDGSPIEVTTEQRPGRVAVSVTDHGPGIRPDQQQAIFDNQAGAEGGPVAEALASSGSDPKDTTSATAEPVLALRAAARLVTRLNGQISLRSTVGIGSTFTVQLPLDQQA